MPGRAKDISSLCERLTGGGAIHEGVEKNAPRPGDVIAPSSFRIDRR